MKGPERGHAVLLCLALLLVLATSRTQAHTQSTAYLTFREAGAHAAGEWRLALRDLNDAIGLDLNDDGLITWGELRARQDAVWAYALSRFHVRAEGVSVVPHPTGFLVENLSDGSYAVLRFDLDAPVSWRRLDLDYHALFDLDLKHRCLLRIENEGQTRVGVLSPSVPSQTFEFTNLPARNPFWTFLLEGVWHIWSGYDHILFLLALLLPGVLRRQTGSWQPVDHARGACLNVLKMVTAFTVAHSITLSLAALGVFRPPTRLVESAIAASVVIAALNNLWPLFGERGWLVAFGFGLLHGFGFANALRDLGLQHGQLAFTLLGFNLGVELGQLAIVLVFLPLALSWRGHLFYRRVVLRAGSAAIMMVAATWLAERTLDFKWLPF